MSAGESIEKPQYQELNKVELRYRRMENIAGRRALTAMGFRIIRISAGPDGNKDIVYEKKQPGVRRYPPVQVELPRDPYFIDNYLNEFS